MIVKFECDGFKNLQNVVLPLRPFQAFVGPNNAGKSNLFDALEVLSMLPDHDLSKITQAVRGDPFEIFTRLPNGSYATTMRLAVELVLDNTFTDEFAGDITLTQTRFRYEVEIARDDDRAHNRVVITAEQLVSLSQGDKLPWQSSAAFRKANLRSRGRRSYISADRDGTLVVHSDGATHGRTFPARKGRQHSVLYVLRDAKAFPHVCAIRNELQRWRFSQLRPDAMREPNAVGGPDRMDSAGRYLMASLYRMLQRCAPDPTDKIPPGHIVRSHCRRADR